MDVVGNRTLEIMSEASWYNNWLYGIIKSFVNEPILEIGGGIGNFTRLLLKHGRVTAIDIEKSYIKKLKKIKSREISAGSGNIESGKYFFKPQKFNTLVCMNVLEHINNDEKALENMYRLTNPNGKLILLVPSGIAAYGSLDKLLGHYQRYSKRDLVTKVSKAGYKIDSVRYLNSLGIFGWWFNGRILRRKILPGGQMRIFNIVARPILLFEKLVEPPFGLSLLLVGTKK